jgi:hypothetical protein
MQTGFFSVISPQEVRGWAYDPSRPHEHVAVEVSCGGRVLGETKANLYRPDLEAAGIGNGDHGFVLYCDTPLGSGEIDSVSVTSAMLGRPLQRLTRESNLPPQPAQPLVDWPHSKTDPTHHPVFILGSARSGTSAVTLALLTATRYKGYGEGHFFDVLAPLTVALYRYLPSNTEERNRLTTLSRLAPDFVHDGLSAIMITAAHHLFPDGYWLDKTPNTNMIHLAPRLLQIWPNAKFVFMKRRGVDNVASRLRKFPYDFARNCREWAAAMEAWLSVRASLADSSIELDQATVALQPDLAADELATLLSLPPIERKRIEHLLATERVQQTGNATAGPTPLHEMGWRPDWVEAFRQICGPMMTAFGYVE